MKATAIATASSVLLMLAAAAGGEETLREFSWSGVQAGGGAQAGRIVMTGAAPFEHLEVVNQTAQASTATVLTVDDPPVAGRRYGIVGQVQCEGVEGQGYLEMWSLFPGGGRYFSRTLDGRGPMRCLTGSQGWRPFVLPFEIGGDGPGPQRLVVNVVLPGRGTVRLGPLRLVQYAPGEDVLAIPGQWWGERTGGLIGGALGVVVGGFGGLMGLLVSRGKARRFVVAGLHAMVLGGVAMLAAGGVSLLRSQPYAVYYPLLLGGGLCAVLGAGFVGLARRRYRELELRKMAASDAAG